jgi:hypothetical protein
MKMPTDLELLRAAPPGHLAAVAEARRLPLAGGAASATGPAALEELARRLFHPPSVLEALRMLSQGQWAILRELARCGGQAHSSDLRLYLLVAGALPGAGRAPDAQTRLYELSLGRLLALGLLFWGRLDVLGGRDYASGAHEGLLVVPPAVLALLPEIEMPEEEAPAPQHPQPRAPRLASVEALQRDLYLLWRVAREQPAGLPLGANGVLPRAALRQVAALNLKNGDNGKSEPEMPYLLFVRALAEALGLLVVRGDALHAEHARVYFALPLVQRAERCYTCWLEGTFWNELLWLSGITLRPAPSPQALARPEVLRGRQAVLELVRAQAVGTWVSRAAVLALARLRPGAHHVLAQRGGAGGETALPEKLFGWEFKVRGVWLSPREERAQVEAAFVAAVLEGPLHWLGLLDLDAPAGQPPLAYRLAPAGAVLLGQGEWSPELRDQQAGRLIVQPNFELVALAPVQEATLLFLDEVAERQSLEQVAQYRLTRERWLHALQQGASAAALIQRLETLAQTPLPQNLGYSLLEWERQARRVRLTRVVTLLEVQEAALLDAFLADPALAPFFLRRLTPTAALVERRHLPALYAALLERGELPKLMHRE